MVRSLTSFSFKFSTIFFPFWRIFWVSKNRNSVFPVLRVAGERRKTLAQQSYARKAGFLYLLKQQFSFSLKHKY